MPALHKGWRRQRAFAHRKHVVARFSHQHHMLPLCGKRVILGDNRPAVIEHRDAVAAGVHHGFNREDHAWFKLGRRMVDGEMVDVGFFMEALADAVTAVVAHN